VYNVGKVFKKPKYVAPTPAATPAPAVEEATKEPEQDTSRKKKRRGKTSLMVDSTNNATGSGGTGINL
jgi:hypothetical protein